MVHKYIFLVFFSYFLVSCSTKRDVIYIQNSDESKVFENKPILYKLNFDDILKISVSSEEPSAALGFNSVSIGTSLNNKESYLYNGYKVNPNGYISFPVIGDIFALGLTTDQLKIKIENQIKERQILLNPYVDVKLLNSYFTVLGEVNNPGRYDFIKNNINIFEALGIAGDMTINGIRNKVRIIRNGNDGKLIKQLDLTSIDLINDPFFYIYPSDVIIVDPNSSRVKNAGVIGNTSTLLTLVSVLVSSIFVITR